MMYMMKFLAFICGIELVLFVTEGLTEFAAILIAIILILPFVMQAIDNYNQYFTYLENIS
jgi:hypothetical protein|tara:strand:- start:497 stop:676 length:180 start_codon:yes stop_codon:yes gene_type:complete